MQLSRDTNEETLGWSLTLMEKQASQMKTHTQMRGQGPVYMQMRDLLRLAAAVMPRWGPSQGVWSREEGRCQSGMHKPEAGKTQTWNLQLTLKSRVTQQRAKCRTR